MTKRLRINKVHVAIELAWDDGEVWTPIEEALAGAHPSVADAKAQLDMVSEAIADLEARLLAAEAEATPKTAPNRAARRARNPAAKKPA